MDSTWEAVEFNVVMEAIMDQIMRHGPVQPHHARSLARRVISLLTVDQMVEVAPATALFVLQMVQSQHVKGVDGIRRKAMANLREELKADDARVDTNNADVIRRSYESVVARLKEEIERLRAKKDERNAQIAELNKKVDDLELRLNDTVMLAAERGRLIHEANTVHSESRKRLRERMKKSRDGIYQEYIALLRFQDDGGR